MRILNDSLEYIGFSLNSLLKLLKNDKIIRANPTLIVQLNTIVDHLTHVDNDLSDYLNDNLGRETLRSNWYYNRNTKQLWYVINSTEIDPIKNITYRLPQAENLRQLSVDLMLDCNHLLDGQNHSFPNQFALKIRKSVLLPAFKKLIRNINKADLERIPLNERTQ